MTCICTEFEDGGDGRFLAAGAGRLPQVHCLKPGNIRAQNHWISLQDTSGLYFSCTSGIKKKKKKKFRLNVNTFEAVF